MSRRSTLEIRLRVVVRMSPGQVDQYRLEHDLADDDPIPTTCAPCWPPNSAGWARTGGT